MEKMWAGRFLKALDKSADDFNSSIHFDKKLYKHDIRGSIEHATMLHSVGILKKNELDAIIDGLTSILSDLEEGNLCFDDNAEDIHMFVEAELTKRIGDAGKKLHTARSRNDQVALDLRLYMRDEANEVKELIAKLTTALLNKAKENLLVNYAAEKVLAGAQAATEAEAKAFYDEHPEEFKSGESVTASHILVDTEESALNILADIKAGKISFEDAAKTYSSCPSKENGGSLGEFTRGQMVPEFDAAAFAMAEGEISEAPVKTQFGYHLIKLTAKKESNTVPFDEVKEGVKNMLSEDKKRRALDSKLNQLKILYPVDYAL